MGARGREAGRDAQMFSLFLTLTLSTLATVLINLPLPSHFSSFRFPIATLLEVVKGRVGGQPNAVSHSHMHPVRWQVCFQLGAPEQISAAQPEWSGALPACLSTAQSPVSCFPSKIPNAILPRAFWGHTHPSTTLKLIRFFVEEIF